MSEQTKMRAPNIHPNPEYYIEREDEIKRIENFIERTDGAVIGLTGVRGAGKSSVMKKIVKYAEGKGYFTLTISSPTGYDEKAFFRMIFMRLCEEVNKIIEKKIKIRKTIEKIGESEGKKNLIICFFCTFTTTCYFSCRSLCCHQILRTLLNCLKCLTCLKCLNNPSSYI